MPKRSSDKDLQRRGSVTFALVKPGFLEHIPEIRKRIEEKGLWILAEQLVIPTADMIRDHYCEHVDKPFYPALQKQFVGKLCYAMVIAACYSSESAANIMKELVGPTKPWEARPDQLRYLARHRRAIRNNVIHTSDSKGSAAERELRIWFGPFAKVRYQAIANELTWALREAENPFPWYLLTQL